MAGTGSTTSSLTSTSHTLTHAPGSMLSPSDRPTPGFLDVFRTANRHAFLKPPSSVPTESLQAVKTTLDAFAGQVADDQQQRLAESGKKRKRGGAEGRPDVLKIRKLHVDGFETSQIWQQTKRIIASTLAQSKEALSELEASNQVTANGVVGKIENGVESEDEDEDLDSDGGVIDGSDELDSDLEDDMLEDEEMDDLEGLEEDDEDDEGSEEEEEDDEVEDDEDALIRPAEEFIEDPNGLNDGFFSIDEFNKQTQMLEDQDARGDPATDQLTDEEDLDWHMDPMAASQPANKPANKRASKGKQALEERFGLDNEDDDAGEEEDEEDGPTFGSMDLFAPEGASDDEMDDMDEADLGPDTNNIFYKDFFAPPPKKTKKGARPNKQQETPMPRPDDNEVERAMADVRRDLFDSESERSDIDDDLSELSAGDPRSRRSAHERRQAKLLDEIRRLEAESVKQKKWTMSGEASASGRPMNSLLDEEMEFEHAGKPIPVVTQEVSESIEAMIKRRIIDQQFDEVLRRYPTDDTTANTRRGLIEIDDTQGKQGLADLYAEEHVKNSNPDTYVSKSEEKQRREEKEIEQMWKEISATLDALSSWHYKPKPAAPSLTVVSDVATVAMEDAQPTTAQGVAGGESMMAPQEIYKAGADNAEHGEVMTKSGLPVARQEMTREERARRRRSQKSRIRKSGSGGVVNGQKTNISKKAQEKKDTMDELRRGGVKVINRKGEVVDIDGNKAKAAKALSSGNFKL